MIHLALVSMHFKAGTAVDKVEEGFFSVRGSTAGAG